MEWFFCLIEDSKKINLKHNYQDGSKILYKFLNKSTKI